MYKIYINLKPLIVRSNTDLSIKVFADTPKTPTLMIRCSTPVSDSDHSMSKMEINWLSE
jgi:hypothetical protein